MTAADGTPEERDVVRQPVADVVVDARGLACPLPVLRLAAAARDAADGTVVTVLWTDPAAAYDVPAWARMRGHELVTDPTAPGTRDADGVGRATIRVARR